MYANCHRAFPDGENLESFQIKLHCLYVLAEIAFENAMFLTSSILVRHP